MTTDVKDTITKTAAEILVSESLGKKWYTSKTVWVNVIAVLSIFTQMKFGFIIDMETQALLLSAVNLILRKVTKEPVVF